MIGGFVKYLKNKGKTDFRIFANPYLKSLFTPILTEILFKGDWGGIHPFVHTNPMLTWRVFRFLFENANSTPFPCGTNPNR